MEENRIAPKQISIKIKVPNSDEIHIFNVSNDITVKELVEKVCGIFPNIPRQLNFRGKPLNFDKKLHECEIDDGFTIQMFPKVDSQPQTAPAPQDMFQGITIQQRMEFYVNRIRPSDPLESPIPNEQNVHFRSKVLVTCEAFSILRNYTAKLQKAVADEDVDAVYDSLSQYSNKVISITTSTSLILKRLIQRNIDFTQPNLEDEIIDHPGNNRSVIRVNFNDN